MEVKKRRGPKPLAPGMKRTEPLRTHVTRIEQKLFFAACKLAGVARPSEKLRELAVNWASATVNPAQKTEEVKHEQANV